MIWSNKNRETIRVAWSWGEGEYDYVELREGHGRTFRTDGPHAYPLVRVERGRNDTITILPLCMMIEGSPKSLREYADILERTHQ